MRHIGVDLQGGHFALVKVCMMLKEEKVTVIVPVYNTEIYLERCLSTIVNQSYKKNSFCYNLLL